MAYVQQNFTVLSFDELADRHRLGQPLPSNAAVITFDDGYEDNYKIAYPIISQKNLPATIFLTTGLMGTRHIMWWDEVAALLQTTQTSSVLVQGLGELKLETSRDRLRAREKLRRYFKSLSEEERRRIQDTLRLELSHSESPTLRAPMYLDWDQVREMHQNGISFGAHTQTHPILTKVPIRQAEYEILASKKAIQAEIGEPVRLFAYPNGKQGDFNARTRELLDRNGFIAAVTLIQGSNLLVEGKVDWLALKRLYIGSDDRPSFIAKTCGALEWFAARLPSLERNGY
jgi:peptidoglycan/xylan/chitin deacetylase (PgdA/CDA1 family)